MSAKCYYVDRNVIVFQRLRNRTCSHTLSSTLHTYSTHLFKTLTNAYSQYSCIKNKQAAGLDVMEKPFGTKSVYWKVHTVYSSI